MQMILFIGIQATGKSSFYRERFFNSHVRINLDMLGTRHREEVLFKACLEAKQRFVVDNTNLTRADRSRYISAAKAAGFSVDGYYFQSRVKDALRRNAGRTDSERVPEKGVLGATGRLEVPLPDEGFDRLFYVRLDEAGGFTVEEWRADAAILNGARSERS